MKKPISLFVCSNKTSEINPPSMGGENSTIEQWGETFSTVGD